ncbi:MAG: complex I subunit 4 family protein [Fluviicola sp.]
MELLLLILPVFFALSVLILPQSFVRVFGILSALVTLGLTVALSCSYQVNGGMHYFLNQEWISNLGLTLTFGYDGIALMMLLLTSGLVSLIFLSNWGRELSSNKAFTSMVFLMQFGLTGVFVALDAIWFYAFWEITLIPIFLITWWYGAPERKAALMKFFIYTFVGSIAMLASIIGLKVFAPSFAYMDLVNAVLEDKEMAAWMMGGFFLAFAIKIPIFPFHTWQPDTYSKAPMAGTMLLSGIMLKMALYGMIRWMLPLFPEALECTAMPIIILATIGVVYGAIIAIKQNDMKRLFAYASMSHVGLIAAGIMTNSTDSISGSVIQMINHGLVAVGLFLAVDVIERRLNTRDLNELGGLAKTAPKFAFWFAALAFASVSVPFTSGFIGEFLLIKGVYDYNWILGIVIGTTLILGAVYTFRAYQMSMYGPVKHESFTDLHWSEMIVFAVIMVVVVVLGVYPTAIMDFIEPSVKSIMELATSTPMK